MAPTSEVEDSAEIPSIPPDPPLLHDVYYQLAAHGPAFFFHGADIEVISSPNEFYESLIDMVKTAEKRIVISSLYLGDGPMEMKLVGYYYCRTYRDNNQSMVLWSFCCFVSLFFPHIPSSLSLSLFCSYHYHHHHY